MLAIIEKMLEILLGEKGGYMIHFDGDDHL
jgi:hypothetical protein